MAEVRINCEWIIEPEARGYICTSPDAPGFVCGADSADQVVAKVPKLLRGLFDGEKADPVYNFFTGPVST